jgi:HAMP domain-containing protein
VSYSFEWRPEVLLFGAVLALLIVPGFAVVGLVVIVAAALAALMVLAAAVLVIPYRLVRALARRLAEGRPPVTPPVPAATAGTAIARPAIATHR